MESPVLLGALSRPLLAPGIGSELEWAGQREECSSLDSDSLSHCD